jgi:hypothetical protein
LICGEVAKNKSLLFFLSNNIVEKRKLYVKDNKNKTMKICESEEKKWRIKRHT